MSLIRSVELAAKVVVIGESLIDRITSVDGTTREVIGGGPFNAARALAQLGVSVGFLGGISSDSHGDAIAEELVNSGAVHLMHSRSPAPTGIAHAQLDTSGSATYSFELDHSACADVTPEDAARVLAQMPHLGVVHVGTLALVLEPLASTTEQFVANLQPGVLVFVDPNCRPSIITNHDAYAQRLDRVLNRADVVKVSREDLAFLFPDVPANTAAGMLHAQSKALVLFTDGADTVCLFGDGFTAQLPVPQIDVVDTVGAGDVFGAAWLAWWLTHDFGPKELSDETLIVAAATYAIGAAGWTCQHSGARVPALEDAPIL